MTVATGCSVATESADDYMDEDVPAGKCMSDSGPCDESDGSDDGTPTPDGCVSTLDCNAGESCAAVFDGDIGVFDCREGCIEDMDETRWCVDDDACCSGGSVCAGRGFCMPLDVATGTDTGTVDTTTTGADETTTGDASTGSDTTGTGG